MYLPRPQPANTSSATSQCSVIAVRVYVMRSSMGPGYSTESPSGLPRVRVVVIGSGLQGVATAWFLAHHGCAVTVLERESAAAQGTSYANAGMLTPSMADPWNAPGIVRHLLGWLGQ